LLLFLFSLSSVSVRCFFFLCFFGVLVCWCVLFVFYPLRYVFAFPPLVFRRSSFFLSRPIVRAPMILIYGKALFVESAFFYQPLAWSTFLFRFTRRERDARFLFLLHLGGRPPGFTSPGSTLSPLFFKQGQAGPIYAHSSPPTWSSQILPLKRFPPFFFPRRREQARAV